jgi:tetratricopeptide (TPR) repeat protein
MPLHHCVWELFVFLHRQDDWAAVPRAILLALLSSVFPCFAFIPLAKARESSLDWRAEVRRCAQRQDWAAAMKIVNQEIAKYPNDGEVRAWRARLLTWSGQLSQAEHEYQQILQTDRTDPDIWLGLSTVYLREGKIQLAEQAIDAAESLDPRRADIRVERGRILQAAAQPRAARLEFQKALELDPTSDAARAGLLAARGAPRQDVRFGQDNDFLSYADSIHGEYVTLTSQWSPGWSTTESGNFFQYYGVQAAKLAASVTRRQPGFAAVTLGGAIGHDNAVIPRSEAFFGFDRGWKIGGAGPVRGLELAYEQHWYWYQSARILTLNGTSILYLPGDWTFSINATGARSAFSATDSEWKPSELARLEFPFARWGEKRLFGNFLFAVGTEDFAEVDQIGRFASQTYGSGLRFQMTPRQGISEYVTYQKRTQNKSDIGVGLSYDIHF